MISSLISSFSFSLISSVTSSGDFLFHLFYQLLFCRLLRVFRTLFKLVHRSRAVEDDLYIFYRDKAVLDEFVEDRYERFDPFGLVYEHYDYRKVGGEAAVYSRCASCCAPRSPLSPEIPSRRPSPAQ